jgi:pimeloyl-ACP methyl ester carboxylesterase
MTEVTSRVRRTWTIAAVVVVAGLWWTAQALASTYAPPDTPGPPLSVPARLLKRALVCTASVAHANRSPILLVPGTTVNPTEFAWNWDRALTARGWPYCTIDLPGNGMGDIQIAGEYVVYAIRHMHLLSGRKIDIVGHSQGGMVPRWALRFWPDTRSMVRDLVGMSPSNHGTLDADVICMPGCAPSIWQQRSTAHFIAALNSYQETFPGISYTSIYTNTDEVVVPNFGPAASSALHGGGGQITNLAIQAVCPLDLTEHIGIGTYDATAFAIAMDALTHPGPADPARVNRAVCLDPLMPGVNPLTFLTDFAQTNAVIATTLATYPHVPAEPPLACYVTASCPARSAVLRPGRAPARAGAGATRQRSTRRAQQRG